MAVHHRLVLGAPVTQEVVQSLQCGFVVAAIALEGDGEIFAGVGVVEGERLGFVQRGGVMNRTGSRKQHQRGEADPRSDLHSRMGQRHRSKLACKTSQHV